MKRRSEQKIRVTETVWILTAPRNCSALPLFPAPILIVIVIVILILIEIASSHHGVTEARSRNLGASVVNPSSLDYYSLCCPGGLCGRDGRGVRGGPAG
jgi:hypothetical protein